MSSVSSALARVKEIQARVAQHTSAPTGDFDRVLDKASAAHGSHLRAVQTPPAAHRTVGAFVHGVAPSVTYRRPPVDGILSGAELDLYLHETGMAARNGRLVDGDLVPVDGGFNGRTGRLAEPAAIGWEKMRQAAAQDGIDLRFVDSYRTWESQHAAHQRFLRGEKHEHVLPAGTSQHGVGLAVDITDGNIIRAGSEEWVWLKANASAFGWWPISNETWHWEFRGT